MSCHNCWLCETLCAGAIASSLICRLGGRILLQAAAANKHAHQTPQLHLLNITFFVDESKLATDNNHKRRISNAHSQMNLVLEQQQLAEEDGDREEVS